MDSKIRMAREMARRAASYRNRTCRKCGQTFVTRAGFYELKHLPPFTYDSTCIQCRREQSADFRESKPNYHRQWTANNPGYVSPCNADGSYFKNYQAKYRKKIEVRDRMRVYRIVAKALKDGTLTKPDQCAGCDKPVSGRGLHGHHSDYALPLQVQWLCSRCHDDLHRAISMGAVINGETGEIYT